MNVVKNVTNISILSLIFFVKALESITITLIPPYSM